MPGRFYNSIKVHFFKYAPLRATHGGPYFLPTEQELRPKKQNHLSYRTGRADPLSNEQKHSPAPQGRGELPRPLAIPAKPC